MNRSDDWVMARPAGSPLQTGQTALESLKPFLVDADPAVRGLPSHQLLGCGARLPEALWHAAMSRETEVGVAGSSLPLRPNNGVSAANNLWTVAVVLSGLRPAEALKLLLEDRRASDSSGATRVANHLRCHPRAD
jgi:hypothetical protein